MKEKKHFSLADFFYGLSIFVAIVSVIMLIATAGGIDCVTMTFWEGLKHSAIWLLTFIGAFVGIVLFTKEDDEYDNL